MNIIIRRLPFMLLLLLLLAGSANTQGTVHSVILNWTAGTGDATFCVYRGTVSGTYTKIGNCITATTFTDTTGIGGTKYFYVVTGVDTTGVESARSNEVSATFLAPPAAPTGLTAVAN